MIRQSLGSGPKALALVMFTTFGLTLVACGSSGSSNGTGGHSGAGGALGTGGHGTGGKTGMGGASMGGAGGSISAACGNAKYTHVSPFGAIFDGWGVAFNSNPPSLFPMPSIDGSAATGTKVELDPLDGSPALGSVKLTIPFNDANQELLFAQNMTTLNMAGTTITAQIKLDSGLSTSPVNVGRAFLIVKSGVGYTYVAGPAVSLDSSAGWVTLTMNTDQPPGTAPPEYDPCDIREIDISIQTGSLGTYTTAVVHIDTIAISLPGNDAGTGIDATSGGDALDSSTSETGASDVPATTDAQDAPSDTPAATDTAPASDAGAPDSSAG